MLPSMMRAVVAYDYEGRPESLKVEELPIPTPKPGQVLVKIAGSPINPSDLVFLRGQYGVTKQLPIVPGFEASGTVVASGHGFLARWLRGKRVACRAPENGHGTWAEYMITDAAGCIPLRRKIPLEAGASLIVNPMTAVALMDQALRSRHPAFVQTAAAGAVGRMILRLGLRHKLTGIHIVRRPEQVAALKALGADYVFDSNDPFFTERLGESCYKFKARIAFDAVGGELSARVLAAMPEHSQLVIYGVLSGEPGQFDPRDMIFSDETIRGFWLTRMMRTTGFFHKFRFASRVQSMLLNELSTEVQGRFGLAEIHQAIEQYKKNRSSGKVLITPHGN